MAAVPLCVDLDGTLIRSDMLMETALALLPRAEFWRSLPSLANGRAAFKRRLATAARFDPALLPYRQDLRQYLAEQRALGRRIVLVTASDAILARRIAEHVGLFDEVIASDGHRNLKGEAKAQLLVARFGRGGFDHIGDSRADLPVWRQARRALVVDPGRLMRRALRDVPVERVFGEASAVWRGLCQAARPHQWVKNLLVFVALFVSGAALDGRALGHALLAFVAFCATASGIYMVNDLADLAADRRHPRKRRRPFASGMVPIPLGLGAAALLLAAGATLAQAAGITLLVLLYLILSLSYSLRLKEFPLVDVFVLAALYTVRLLAGGVATGHFVSLWLLAFSGLLFLSLALVKRVGELNAAGLGGGPSRRDYTQGDLLILQMFGCCTAVGASLVLALFVQSETTAARYASPALLWGIVPLTLFWQCRIWLSTARGYMHDDPIVYAARDWVSWLVVLAAAAVVVLARSTFLPGWQ
jgi:4-hydroxybenzoate polyprenyltransferase/phosphoserine phosphatase